MKTFALLTAIFGLVSAVALRAADSPKPARVDVIFDHPEKFTDIKDASQPSKKGEDYILGQIHDFLVDQAKSFIPEDCHLTLTFTDIDLAGEFEPWHGGQWNDVRMVKPIYPPAFKFTWSVTDSQGQVVKQGTADIRDLNFTWRADATIDRDDPLHIEKSILGDWVRGNLGDIKRTASQR